MKIKVPLSDKGIETAYKEVERYRVDFANRVETFVRLLAEHGMNAAKIKFYNVPYDGDRDVTVTVEDLSSSGDRVSCKVVASGRTALVLEFGAGAKMGYGYNGPANPYGPGTWSDGPDGKGHWKDDHWYYDHHRRSSGNPPAMAMWGATEDMVAFIETAWRGAFT